MLHEDDGVTPPNNSTQGTDIEFTWVPAKRLLEVSARRGAAFPGMLHSRTLRIVLVAPGHGAGVEPTPQPDFVVVYRGRRLSVQL